MVAFHNIKADICRNAKQQANEDITKAPSKDEDNGQDESWGCLADKDARVELNNNIDFTSAFLCSMFSDEKPSPNFNGLTPLTAATCTAQSSQGGAGELVVVCYMIFLTYLTISSIISNQLAARIFAHTVRLGLCY